LTSIEMLRAQQARTRVTPEEEQEGTDKEDVAIFPLAIPLLAGPGSIATVTALMGRAGHFVFMVPVVVSIAVTCFACYLMLRAAGGCARRRFEGSRPRARRSHRRRRPRPAQSRSARDAAMGSPHLDRFRPLDPMASAGPPRARGAAQAHRPGRARLSRTGGWSTGVPLAAPGPRADEGRPRDRARRPLRRRGRDGRSEPPD